MPTPTATRRPTPRDRTPTSIATTSSARSTPTSRSISSSSSNWPATSWSPASCKNLSPEDQDRLIATGFLRMSADGTATGASTQDAGPQPGHRRHDQDRLHVAVGPDRRLRPVPRPSLRSDSAGGLLSPARRVRAGLQLEGLESARPAAGLAVDRRRSGQGGRGRRRSRAK